MLIVPPFLFIVSENRYDGYDIIGNRINQPIGIINSS